MRAFLSMEIHISLEDSNPGTVHLFAEVVKRKRKQWKEDDLQEVNEANGSICSQVLIVPNTKR